ncbi:hypothetical protein NEMIN01_0150 [Nematocida minor]|uniref:uncharacterized protein n=1 Tax=Nematocida minor TaxID=1912983 RepID=UPI00222077EF|nr:uncharacterized protein NEMIN01_0046 [Nematocida minor]XP_051332052.1 uncharacterized protein NEMIN01_0150 [Nematocida minor]KAI5188782.1 hypothetical protein NEMIN01_0046 [Nematocida minor]KAI5188886.1 hypothetical protein NEMIN01_0150 [Nematocida minor]
MEHTPPFSSVHAIEGIQTANKNIYSYFMKNDSSYYVPQCYRYAGYKKDTDILYIVVISKYTSTTGDFLYKHNSNSIKIECLIGKSLSNLQTKKTTLSDLFEVVREIEYSLPGMESIKASDVFIGLVYPDGLNRVSIMNMVDCVLNHAGFKGILLLPMSLSISLGLGISNSVFFSSSDKTISLIEDNCIFDTFTEGMESSTTLYGSDIVEEFLKKEEPMKHRTVELVCHLCNQPFEIGEFSMHFLNKHAINIYDDKKYSDTMLQKCGIKEEPEKQLEPGPNDLLVAGKEIVYRMAPAERVKKITSAVILVTSQAGTTNTHLNTPEGDAQDAPAETVSAVDIESIPEDSKQIVSIIEDTSGSSFLYVSESEKTQVAWNGLFALTNIEPSKDMWLTDKEWQSVGLRILKEKVLFPL